MMWEFLFVLFAIIRVRILTNTFERWMKKDECVGGEELVERKIEGERVLKVWTEKQSKEKNEK